MKANVNPRLYEITMGYCTHVGRRTVNEDAWYLAAAAEQGSENPRGRLWAVADGIGGHSGGREASHLACRGLQTFFERPLANPKDQSARALCRHLTETVLRVDRLVRQRAASRESLTHMGTTLSCLLLAGGHSIIAHVGDSRIYRLRRDYLSCLTVDHTFVQDMIFEGEVEPGKAHLHPLRHMLTRAVGAGEPLALVDTRIDILKPDDCFLLCTDGLYNAIDEKDIYDLLNRQFVAGDTAIALVTKAQKCGACDNITAVVVKLNNSEDIT